MSIPELVKSEIAKAIGQKSTGLRITLRQPIEFQSNRLYDVWADGHHYIAKEYLKPDELEVAPSKRSNSFLKYANEKSSRRAILRELFDIR